MNDELKSLYCWFDLNRDEIIKNHKNERVLITISRDVIGYYKNEKDAFSAVEKNSLKDGEFLIQWCIPEDEELKMTFNVGAYFG